MNPFKALSLAGRKAIRPVMKLCNKVKNGKPEIFIGTGIVLVIGSFVWVAVEATKAPEVMTRTSDKVKEIEDSFAEVKEGSLSKEGLASVIKDEKKQLRKARANGVYEMAKLFGGPIVTLAGGCWLIIRGGQIFRIRNAVLGAALKSTEKMFDFYRGNVIRDQGKEADQKYMRGVIGETEIAEVGHDECGNEILKKEIVPVIQSENPWIIEFSPEYFRAACGIPDVDLTRIAGAEAYFNHLYDGPKKYYDISAYEILEYLGPNWEKIDPTGERRMIFRNYGYAHDINGDNRIDLGRFRAVNHDAINGTSPKVYIEMNVDGRLEKLRNQYVEKYILKG